MVTLDTADAAYAVIRIDDDGPGVPADALSSIFAPFFRVPGGAETHPNGSGLGLSISARIAQRHGATLTATNRESCGLRVTLSLPATAVSM